MMQHPERAPLPLTSLEGPAAAGLEVAAPACPDCCLLRLDVEPDACLAPAQRLSRLTELVLMSPCEPCPGLEQLLAARGAALTSLALNGVTEVPLAAALRHCRALQSLTLIMCQFRAEPAPGAPLSELQHLWLAEDSGGGAPPADLLRRALGSPALTSLSLQQSDTLTDGLLEEALDAGGLQRLETVALMGCDRVTVAPLLRLVLQCPRLETLRMELCAQLSRQDAADVRRLAEDNGWRLQVVWQ